MHEDGLCRVQLQGAVFSARRTSGVVPVTANAQSLLPAPSPPMSEDDVGEFFIRQDGSVWRLLIYAASPTATLERIWPDQPTVGGRREHIGGCVGAPIFAGFKRLRAE